MTALPPIETLAELLYGDACGVDRVLCPGPNHSPDDRSLSVMLDVNDRDGFKVHSFSGDDWKQCRDHVANLLHLPEPPQKKHPNTSESPSWTTDPQKRYGKPGLSLSS